jgi:phosphorylcholine metabolism protein LicD
MGIGKKHKYESQADLKDMTREEIVRIDPKDIGLYVETETGDIPLTGDKKKALTRLLAIKRLEKENPSASSQRDKLINDFEKREGWVSNPEVDRLIIDTTKQVEYGKLADKKMGNRLLALGDKPIVPLTEEEELWDSLENLEKGGRKTRKYRKFKTKRRPYKSKKSKTNKRKSKISRKSLRKRKV